MPDKALAVRLKRFPANHLTFLSAALTTVITFLFYLLTLEPDLNWANFGGDGGELITAAVTLGIPHPPGYPTYVLLGNLFGRIPLGPVAFRFHLLSALATAVSTGFLAALVFHLRPASKRRTAKLSPIKEEGNFSGIIAAVAAGLTFGFGSLVRGQAVIAEVYPLNLAFISAFLYLSVSAYAGATLGVAQDPAGDFDFNPVDQKSHPFLSGLLLGLAITTHLTSIILLPLALLIVPRRNWLRLGGGLLSGLLPFLLLPLLAQSGSPIIWGQPDNLTSWWWLVSAQLYRPNVFSLPVTAWAEHFRSWSLPFLAQFAYLGLLPIGVGLLTLLKAHTRLLIALFASALLYIFYAFTYNTNDAAVLLLPALLLLSVILGFGLHHAGKAAIILPFALLWLNLGQSGDGYYVNQTTAVETTVRLSVEALLTELPADAIVLTPGDPTIAALWYFHHVEGKRPDITIIDSNLFQFEWYREQLGRNYPFLDHLDQDDLPGFKAINSQQRPYCEASLVQPGFLNC